MSEGLASLRRKIDGAGELESVVRSMKALAASSISQYENAVLALNDYYRTVELGLGACFRELEVAAPNVERGAQTGQGAIGAIVFGSGQGLVGRFNDEVADFAVKTLSALPGEARVWAVGERVHARLADAGLRVIGLFQVPHSVDAIAELVGQIQVESQARRAKHEYERVYVFHNRPRPAGLYEPSSQRLLPLDTEWQRSLTKVRWPSSAIVEVLAPLAETLRALVGEYLFISLFRACAESLASENASRLASMQRAEENIRDMLEDLKRTFHRLRQDSIDEELFDVIAGCEALSKSSATAVRRGQNSRTVEHQ